MALYKGLFWYNPVCNVLIKKCVRCDKNGIALEPIDYSSKSGDNFNHKAEWSKMPDALTGGHQYNYYPRGRVEIKNNKATIYFNPILNTPDIMNMIITDFGLEEGIITVLCVPDGSTHYRYLIEHN